MALASVQSCLSAYQRALRSRVSRGLTPLRCVQSQGCRSSGQKGPESLLPGSPTIIFFFFSRIWSPLFRPHPHYLYWHFSLLSNMAFSWRLSETLLAEMKVSSLCKCWLPLMACSFFFFFYKLRPPSLSEVKLYLGNFREIVTKISFWSACNATTNLVRTNTDICLFPSKQQHDCAFVSIFSTLLYCGDLNNNDFFKIFFF